MRLYREDAEGATGWSTVKDLVRRLQGEKQGHREGRDVGDMFMVEWRASACRAPTQKNFLLQFGRSQGARVFPR